MSDLIFYTEDGAYWFTNSELIEHLEGDGYMVIGNEVDFIDNIHATMFEEIQQKFLNGSWEERENIYNLVVNL